MDNNVLYNDILSIRRELHMYPEKGLLEHKTSRYIAEFLRSLNMDVLTGVGGTGIIGIIKGYEGGASIAIRADMDCLDVVEENCVEYKSRHEGLMHACGHDGHMAAVLGLAKVISSSGVKYKKDIIFIFQPAEEGPGGAKLIVDSGVLEGLNIKVVIGMHIFPELREGIIGCCSGPITARNGEIDIEILGKSGHGALPHTAIDSIVISSQLIEAIQTIITRRIDPRENAVITFGKVYGGEARNIIAGKVNLEGTIRAFSREVYKVIKDGILSICRGMETLSGCRINVEIRDMYPEVYNDKRLFDMLLDSVDEREVDIIKPLMIAEDFSYYRQVAPELMFLLGSRNEDKGFVYPLHSSRFNFDERILLKAVSIYLKMIEKIDEE